MRECRPQSFGFQTIFLRMERDRSCCRRLVTVYSPIFVIANSVETRYLFRILR